MPDQENTNALTTIIKVLTPLKSEDRRRTVDAAMLFLGETARAAATARHAGKVDGEQEVHGSGYVPTARAEGWMTKNGVSAEELEQVFHFNDDGTFDIHDVPGESNKEKTLNTYVLTGLGKLLSSNDRSFDDEMARSFCKKIGCYDIANHNATLKRKGAELSGDKRRGYTLTSVGVKRGAVLVKELASWAK
jgi:hypothetical protein